MTEKQQPSERGLDDAIRAHNPSNDNTDLTALSKTLVKSGLWKKLTLERIESSRNSNGDEGSDREVLQKLKAAVGDVVEEYWQDLVRSAADKIAHSASSDSADPANDSQREATNAKKLLALHEVTMREARYRLYEQWARVYVRNRRIDSMESAIAGMQLTHAEELDQQRTRYAKLHEAFEEFQKEADQLLEQLDRENFHLKAGARKQQADS